VVGDIKQHKSQFKYSNFTITQSAKFFWHWLDSFSFGICIVLFFRIH